MESSSKRKITFWIRLSYGGANLLGSGALAITSSWLLIFYTSFSKLTVLQATFILSLGIYLNVILNPIFGFISDNFGLTRLGQKIGRRRFFILLGIPLMAVYPLQFVAYQSFFWYLATFVGFQVVYTMVCVPYTALASEMTSNFEQRNYLSGFKAMFGKLANFLAAALPGVFFGIFGEKSFLPYLLMAVTMAFLIALALTLLYFNSWEKEGLTFEKERIVSFGQGLKKLFLDISSTFRIRTFRRHLYMYLFSSGAEWLFAATFTYFVVFVLQQPKTFVSGMNSLSSLLQLFSTMFFIVWCAKKGFVKPFRLALGML